MIATEKRKAGTVIHDSPSDDVKVVGTGHIPGEKPFSLL